MTLDSRQSKVGVVDTYELRFDERETAYTALCAVDGCRWTQRGATCGATHRRAEEHVRRNGHTVTVYEEAKTRITASAVGKPRHSESEGDDLPVVERDRYWLALSVIVEHDFSACTQKDVARQALRGDAE